MASDIRIDISGIDALLRAEPGKVSKWLDGLAESITGDAKLSMGSSPAGATYQRGGVTHVASLPGYPPNVDIGSLINSLHWEPTGTNERTIMDGVEYGIYLEDGTENMLPRPFMKPAFDRARADLPNTAKSGLDLENF